MTDTQKDVSLPPAIFIMGPTASGKTDLAVKLIEHFPIEIISVDSALIYKEMSIGTAKPDKATLEKAPHRLIDFLDPSKAYSAADFRRDALLEMKDITSRGNIPVLVGGTMLYYRALEHDLAKLPSANPEIRKKIDKQAAKEGWHVLHQQLQVVDPNSAARIHPNDSQRIQRALEVYEITGKPLTSLHKAAKHDTLPYRLLKIALIPDDREWLRERAALRFEQMIEQGFLDEIQLLYDRGDLNIDLPSIRCVGYRQAWDYINNNIDFNEMKNRAIVATRQLAKRQMTWLRSEKKVSRYDAQHYDLSSIVGKIRRFLR
ncbi:MAG TPA: tRNA (adenosine(37)-N6)-dimethylallyltransferase MiaA [Leucothrix mucor]|nr:tRNA (adenosine(37)-N6)-dimethylallyltransferase MiaA [Leucothrix mucor]